MNQKHIISVFTAASLIMFCAFVTERYFLKSEALKFADNKSFGITDEHIGFTMQVVREITKIQFGEKTPNGLVGIFTHNGKKYTTNSLCKLEGNTTVTPVALQPVLKQAKEHFLSSIAPFMAYARGVRSIILEVIEEECHARNKPDSFLLSWGRCEDGAEDHLFTTEIQSFKALDAFMSDLTDFLKDFVYSCPKARAAFLAKIKEQQQNAKP